MTPGRERPPKKGTILIVDDMVPQFDMNAGAAFMLGYIRLLDACGVKVVYLPHDRQQTWPYTGALQALGVEVLPGEFSVKRWLAARGSDLDWVLLARPNVAVGYLEPVRRHTRARLLYYTHDLHHLRELRRYQTTGDRRALRESEQLRKVETRIFQAVDCVTTPSSEEVPVIEGMAPGKEVRVLTPWIASPRPCEPASRSVPLDQRQDVLFVGGYQHLPNVDAAVFLGTEVMPLVWRQVPSARLLLVGSKPTPEVLSLHGRRILVTGYVPDLDPYYALARATVNPIRFGSGLKGKILASMAAGIPVVTTSIGNEGIGLVSGVDGLVADDASSIASHIVALFQNPGQQKAIALGGARTYEDRFGENRARRDLLAALEGGA
jgi:glycosyltransferase involved in cell wall biosynthesis